MVVAPTPLLETDRLVGEPVGMRHRAEAEALFGDPRVAEWIWPGDRGGPRTPEQVDEILKRFVGHWRANGFGWWYLYSRATDEFVGEVGLQRTEITGEPLVEVGWTMLPERWGRGYATEAARAALERAFGPLGLDEVVAYTLPDNRASRRVMEKLGMELAGDVVHAGLPHVLYRRSKAIGRRSTP